MWHLRLGMLHSSAFDLLSMSGLSCTSYIDPYSVHQGSDKYVMAWPLHPIQRIAISNLSVFWCHSAEYVQGLMFDPSMAGDQEVSTATIPNIWKMCKIMQTKIFDNNKFVQKASIASATIWIHKLLTEGQNLQPCWSFDLVWPPDGPRFLGRCAALIFIYFSINHLPLLQTWRKNVALRHWWILVKFAPTLHCQQPDDTIWNTHACTKTWFSLYLWMELS